MTRKKRRTSERRRTLYRSSIPSRATEVVTRSHSNGKKEAADYYLKGQKVGVRYWWDNGQVEYEWGLQGDGSRHGHDYEFAPNGQMTFKSRYVNGREHGTARQWNDKGELLITYKKHHGVGLDLWCDNLTGKLSEEKYYPDDGQIGLERWWTNERVIWREAFWLGGCGDHGIEREWNAAGKLSRGFPKYFVRCQQVTKRQYLRACETDPTLPRFIAAENRPYRKLPASYVLQRDARHVRRSSS